MTFQDGSTTDLEDGLAACLGYSEYTDKTDACSDGHFVFSCDGAAWVGRGGAQFDVEQSARRDCEGGSLEEAAEYCQQATPCEDLAEADFEGSQACRVDPISGVCETSLLGACEEIHNGIADDAGECDGDQACSWE